MGVGIIRDAFIAYETIRRSGLTNMFDAKEVIRLSDGRLDEESIKYIMNHYSELEEEYL